VKRALLACALGLCGGCTAVEELSLGAHDLRLDAGGLALEDAGVRGPADDAGQADAGSPADAAAEDAGWDDPFHKPDGGHYWHPECFWDPRKCPPPPFP
jgi:hypothetical protein